jgi:hypothetical protein
MTSTNQKIKKFALKKLGPIPEDKAERKAMAQTIWYEVDKLLKVVEDARWSGDTERVKALRYPIMIKRAMYRILSRNGLR